MNYLVGNEILDSGDRVFIRWTDGTETKAVYRETFGYNHFFSAIPDNSREIRLSNHFMHLKGISVRRAPEMIDLHTHSNNSDGSMSPTELVKHAYAMGLRAIALTDHDTVTGVAEAVEAGKKLCVEVVPGIEFSVSSETETHILGYYIDITSEKLAEALKAIHEVRSERTRNTCRKLNELGFDVTMEEALAIAPAGIIGRAHFAKIMVGKGYASSVKECFDKYLANGRPAYDGTQYLTAADAIRLIDACGGVSFVAHPHLIRLDNDTLAAFLKELKAEGLCGIEGYYNEYTPEMQEEFQSMARSLGLMISGGTDYHAAMKPHIEIGIGQGNMQIPYKVLKDIKTLVKSRGGRV